MSFNLIFHLVNWIIHSFSGTVFVWFLHFIFSLYLSSACSNYLYSNMWCRELLVSICYNESGWQWSGSFLPDHLGDTQLKMRNFVFGSSNMIRVEVQNADISMGDEKIVRSIKGNSGTNLILLSDDDTGYMPYRIDNFSKEVCLLFFSYIAALVEIPKLLNCPLNGYCYYNLILMFSLLYMNVNMYVQLSLSFHVNVYTVSKFKCYFKF